MKITVTEKEYSVDFNSIFIYAEDEDEARIKAIEFIKNGEVTIDQIICERMSINVLVEGNEK